MTGRLALSVVAAALLAIVSATPSSAADFQETAAGFMKDLGGRFLSSAAPEGELSADSVELIVRFMDEGLDMDLIGRFTLGRYWSQASAEERTEFVKLLGTRIARLLMTQVRRYAGGEIHINRVVEINTKRQDVVDALVVSQISRPDGKSREVLWRLRETDEGPRIIDLVISGVSMVAAQRDEFAAVIRRNNGSVSVLIEQMRAKTKS